MMLTISESMHLQAAEFNQKSTEIELDEIGEVADDGQQGIPPYGRLVQMEHLQLVEIGDALQLVVY